MMDMWMRNMHGLANAWGLVWVVFVAFHYRGAVFYRKSFSLLVSRSGEGVFDTAGLLLLVGVALAIVLVGAVVMLVAWVIAAAAFFPIRPPPTAPPS